MLISTVLQLINALVQHDATCMDVFKRYAGKVICLNVREYAHPISVLLTHSGFILLAKNTPSDATITCSIISAHRMLLYPQKIDNIVLSGSVYLIQDLIHALHTAHWDIFSLLSKHCGPWGASILSEIFYTLQDILAFCASSIQHTTLLSLHNHYVTQHTYTTFHTTLYAAQRSIEHLEYRIKALTP